MLRVVHDRRVRLTSWIPAAAIAGLITTAACGHPVLPTVPVVSFDAELRLQPDGSVLVKEQIELPKGPQPAALERRLTTLRHEGIAEVTATAADPQVPYPGTVGESGDTTVVRWTFGDVPARTLTLSYRARGVVYVSGLRGRVSMEVLPPGHGLAIERARVSLFYPPASILMGDPWVEEAGWEVAHVPGGVQASRTGVDPRESLTIGGEFSIDTFGLAEPAWQYHGARAKEFMPAFVSGGLLMLVVGAGVLGMVRLRHPARLPADADPERPAVARGLWISGLVTMAAAVIAVPIVGATLSTFGPWPYALPAGTFVAGVLFLWMGRRL